jgi:hypothetical protein
MTKFTRRDVLDSLVMTAAAATLESPAARAQPANDQSAADRQALAAAGFQAFRDFILVSAALTGIQADLLAPDRKPLKHDGKIVPDAAGMPIPDGADPTQAVKLAYFNLATSDPAYTQLQTEFKAQIQGKTDPQTLTNAATHLLMSTQPVSDLARSIIMAWYFGAWYEWRVPHEKARFTIVSAEAYSQSWAWRIAQAHPAGNSNLRFGHWAFPPPPALDPGSIMMVGDQA